ncbi:MAG: glycosyltransferase, partial [Chloroflexota bacterium]
CHFHKIVSESIPISIVSFSNAATVRADFTTDRDVLLSTVEALTPGGVTALYDAATLGMRQAASTNSPENIVVLLSDGAEYGGQSSSTRADVIELAEASDVSIITIGLGFGSDRSFLEELSTITDATYYGVEEVPLVQDVFLEIVEVINEQVGEIDVASASEGSAQIAPLSEDVASAGDPSAEAEFPNFTPNLQQEVIVPLNQEFVDLGLGEESAEAESEAVDVVAPADTDTDAINPSTLEQPAPDLVTNLIPVEIRMAESLDVDNVTATINGITVASMTEAPFTFELDTDILTEGLYRLGIQTQSVNGVISEGVIEIEVEEVVLTDLEPMPSDEVSLISDADEAELADEAEASLAPSTESSAIQKVIKVNGIEQSLVFDYSPLTGLVLAEPVLPPEESTVTLGAILLQPFDNVPEPVVEFIMTPRPTAVTITIILMTLILLPQGIFTIYWMTYTWITPERLEKSSSPKKFYDPEISFTALVPARKEAAVIYDTIMSINAIDYPESLKETLVLIRDEDDDETISEAKRAIKDIRQTYLDNDETPPDNIRLVTFTTGPYNKPNGLNRGYRASTKDVICIFDAEDNPHHEVYDVMNTVMVRDNADVVQGGVQLMNFESKWFSAFNCLEYFFWFKSGLHAFTYALGVTPLGGNTVFFKKTWLDKLAEEDTEMGYRCWDEEGLTEDADIGIRLTEMGAKIQIVYDPIRATREETPDSVEQFIKQRTRWDHGFYQIFMKGIWLRLPTLKQKVTAFYVLTNSILQALIMLFLPIGLFIAFTQQVAVPIALISYIPIYILIIQLGLNMVGIKEFTEAYDMRLPLFFRLKMLLSFYPFQLLLSVSAARAIMRFLTNQSNWEKTAHSNLHRQSSTAST